MRASNPTVAFLFPAFPVLHQTFVLWEVLALRELGIDIKIFSIKRPDPQLQQPEAAPLIPEVSYLPPTLSHRVLVANLRTFAAAPWRYISVFVRLLSEWWRDRATKSLWRKHTRGTDSGEEMLNTRLRLRRFFNQSAFTY